MKSILELGKTASTPAIHFLTGELPIEGKIHRDIFSLFYCIWYNPDMKIHDIVKYLTQHSTENSRTWSAHLRHLCNRYGLENPFISLCNDPPNKSVYKELIMTKITVYFENELRQLASTNTCMEYLNVSAFGLRGRHHPALSGMINTREVQQSRSHLKFLTGNYLTYKRKAEQSGGSAHCRICMNESESTSHIIASCMGMSDQRTKLLSELEQLCTKTRNKIDFAKILANEQVLCQFILDPSSLNLYQRVSLSDPVLNDFYRFSRQYCYIIDQTRINLLNQLRIENSARTQ